MRIHKFILVSGTGWLMDVGILTGLVALHVNPLTANFISAGTAVTFVYCVSQRHIFVHDRGHTVFLFYAAWQLIAVSAASFAVSGLAALLVVAPWMQRLVTMSGGILPLPVGAALVAKGLVTPFALYANFLFMGWLLEKRLSWR